MSRDLIPLVVDDVALDLAGLTLEVAVEVNLREVQSAIR
jgi:hypothetical protein